MSKAKGVIKERLNLVVDNNSNLDPRAWNKRYFKHASCSWFQLDALIKGINEIMFNSSASQIIAQWLEVKARIVLKNKVDKNKLKKGYIVIKERKETNLSSRKLEAFSCPGLSLIIELVRSG